MPSGLSTSIVVSTAAVGFAEVGQPRRHSLSRFDSTYRQWVSVGASWIKNAKRRTYNFVQRTVSTEHPASFALRKSR